VSLFTRNDGKMTRYWLRILLAGSKGAQRSVEGYACFRGDVAQIPDDGKDDGYTIFAAQLFGLPFGISGNERAASIRCGFCGAEHAGVIVNLVLERIDIIEAVDSNRPEEMTDPLPNTALWRFVVNRERRCKGPPIRPTQHATQNVHHHGQGVSFMSSAFAIRAQRRKGSPRHDVVRVGGDTTVQLSHSRWMKKGP
jgi:hypothetical protein